MRPMVSIHDHFFAPSAVVADLHWVRARLLDPAASDDERSPLPGAHRIGGTLMDSR